MSAAGAHAAFSQAWPAFALVGGLLLIGAAAAREGLFATAGAVIARAPGGPLVLLAELLLVEGCLASRFCSAPPPAPWTSGCSTTRAGGRQPGSQPAPRVVVNNLPAAVVLSSHLPAHPRALLLGLDLGPNLAVTGSLSAVLWLQVARAADARPSVVRSCCSVWYSCR